MCVLVCPTEVTISPDGGVVEVGTNFTCSGPSTPESNCSCTLTDAKGNVKTGEVVAITETGSYSLECTATLSVNGTAQCNATNTAEGEAISK